MSNPNWMSQLPDPIKHQLINHIIVPGTHDSGSWILDFKSSSLLPWAQDIIKDWTLTQEKSIYDQLMLGIRSLDLRISYDTQYYVSHTFICEPLDEVLAQIQLFLTQYPTEIIVLNMKSDWDHRQTMTPEHNDDVMAKIKLIFGLKLCPVTSMFSKYCDLINQGHQIILAYEGDFNNHYDFNWPQQYFNIPWDNTSNLTTKEQMLNSDMDNFKYADNLYNGISFTLTPQDSDVILDIIKRILEPDSDHNSIKKMSNEVDTYLSPLLSKYQNKLTVLSCIIFDFPTVELVNQVIQLNYRLTPDS